MSIPLPTLSDARFDPLRQWASDRLLALASRLWQEAEWIKPPVRGPRCPDCGIGPAEPEACEYCEQRDQQSARDRDMYDAGWNAGLDRAGGF